MKLYYGEIIAGGSQPPEFQSMMKGCIGYVTKSGEKIYYGKSKVTPSISKPKIGSKTLKSWYPHLFS